MIRAETEIRRAIKAWEKRVQVTEVTITNPSEGKLYIVVKWIANGSLTGSTSVPFTFSTQV
jgi:phage baseplate assembly protein W